MEMVSKRKEILKKGLLFIGVIIYLNVNGQVFKTEKVKQNANIEFEFTVSQFNELSGKYIDLIKSQKIDPKKSVLVLIDVWDLEFLDSMIITTINPLIK
jgi:hypothetical protein